MGFSADTLPSALFSRLRSWKSPVLQDLESRRRLRASLMILGAMGMGVLSSQSIQKQSVHDYRLQSQPTLKEVTLWMRQLGWRLVDPALIQSAPPSLESPGSWWLQEGEEQVWYIESKTEAHLFQAPGHRAPKKLSVPPSPRLLGVGWEATPALLSAMVRPPERSLKRGTASKSMKPSHSKEWQF